MFGEESPARPEASLLSVSLPRVLSCCPTVVLSPFNPRRPQQPPRPSRTGRRRIRTAVHSPTGFGDRRQRTYPSFGERFVPLLYAFSVQSSEPVVDKCRGDKDPTDLDRGSSEFRTTPTALQGRLRERQCVATTHALLHGSGRLCICLLALSRDLAQAKRTGRTVSRYWKRKEERTTEE